MTKKIKPLIAKKVAEKINLSFRIQKENLTEFKITKKAREKKNSGGVKKNPFPTKNWSNIFLN